MKTLSWDKIQQGDEEAFRQLYEQYADLLYGYGMKIAGDETLVTEAIQSLFVYIFEKRETCTAPQSIPAYLCVSLRHMIVNELKKENSGSLKSLDEVGTNEYQFDLEIDIETAIIRSELEKEQLEVLQKELNNFRNSLEVGQKVITAGGIYGKIKEVKEAYVLMEIDNNVHIRVDKNMIMKDPKDLPQPQK